MPTNKEPVILFTTDALCDYQGTLYSELVNLRGLFEQHDTKDTAGNLLPHIKERVELLTTHPSWLEKLRVRGTPKTIYDSARELGYHPLIVATHPSHDGQASLMFDWLKRNFSTTDYVFPIQPQLVNGDVFVDVNPERIQKWQEEHKKGLVIMVSTSENAKTYKGSFYDALSKRINKK